MSKETPRVGLALGGGAARGLAHIGVIEVLESEGIPIHLIAGTSMGAVVGAVYAKYRDASWLEAEASNIGWRRLAGLVDPALPRSGLIAGKRVKRFLEDMIGPVRFEELQVPLYCVATDIVTGDEVVIASGLVVEGVRASAAVPVVFSPVPLGGRFLVDGGLVDSVPVGVARERGAEVVIGVNVMPRRQKPRRVYLEGDEVSGDAIKPPGLFTIISQTISTPRAGLDGEEWKKADVVIEPSLSHLGLTDFGRSQEFIQAGREAAQAALPRIKEKLGQA